MYHACESFEDPETNGNVKPYSESRDVCSIEFRGKSKGTDSTRAILLTIDDTDEHHDSSGYVTDKEDFVAALADERESDTQEKSDDHLRERKITSDLSVNMMGETTTYDDTSLSEVVVKVEISNSVSTEILEVRESCVESVNEAEEC